MKLNHLELMLNPYIKELEMLMIWLHLLIDELGYKVLDVPFERKTREELMHIIKDRLDAMLDKSFDYYRKYAFVYLERLYFRQTLLRLVI